MLPYVIHIPRNKIHDFSSYHRANYKWSPQQGRLKVTEFRLTHFNVATYQSRRHYPFGVNFCLFKCSFCFRNSKSNKVHENTYFWAIFFPLKRINSSRILEEKKNIFVVKCILLCVSDFSYSQSFSMDFIIFALNKPMPKPRLQNVSNVNVNSVLSQFFPPVGRWYFGGFFSSLCELISFHRFSSFTFSLDHRLLHSYGFIWWKYYVQQISW